MSVWRLAGENRVSRLSRQRSRIPCYRSGEGPLGRPRTPGLRSDAAVALSNHSAWTAGGVADLRRRTHPGGSWASAECVTATHPLSVGLVGPQTPDGPPDGRTLPSSSASGSRSQPDIADAVDASGCPPDRCRLRAGLDWVDEVPLQTELPRWSASSGAGSHQCLHGSIAAAPVDSMRPFAYRRRVIDGLR